jgi:predicted ATPase/DNA-binding SARP family transcriptional activator/DNA-binding CsgD family transcriptional regulator
MGQWCGMSYPAEPKDVTGSGAPTGKYSRPMRVWLLGGFRITVGSRIIEERAWRLKKAGALVKLLVLTPDHRLHREQAIDTLWPDSGRKTASNSLRKTLHAARRTLDPDAGSRYLASRDGQLFLHPEGPLWVDIEVFGEMAATARRARDPAAYRAAIELYAGDLLPEDRYEVWAEERREELLQTYLGLLMDLAKILEERGEYGLAVEALRQVLAQEPTSEETHSHLMRLYMLSGRPERAIKQYARLKMSLARELGTEASPSTQRLHEVIAAGEFPSVSATGRTLEVGRAAEPSDTGKHNLPAPRNSFVGREREMTEIKRELAMTRLLTLMGAGGSGKTRLALEVARDLVGAYPDGVWLVELAGLSEGDLVPQAVAAALGVKERPGQPFPVTLVELLRAKQTLLVVDNCEHLLKATAGLVDILLDSCPHLRILATSREALNVTGEVRLSVPALYVPDPQDTSSVEKVEGSESVRLFVERACQRAPTFALTSGNVEAVAEICRKLDGIPLALELAAARVGVLAVTEIASRLGDSLKLLTGGGRTVVPRQRTLRGALDWSYELLLEAEKKLFMRLSVFAGGWTLEASEAVASGEGVEEGEVLDLLSGLVEKSLVVAEPTTEGGVRYRLLELVRQYAQEKLTDGKDADVVHHRHAAFFLTLAQQAEPELTGPEQTKWLERLDADHDNLRAAISWSSEAGKVELELRLGCALRRFWHRRGHLSEGLRWLLPLRSCTARESVLVKVLEGTGWLAEMQGNYELAEEMFQTSLRLYKRLGDEKGIAISRGSLGWVALVRGDIDGATKLLRASLEVLRPLKDEREGDREIRVLDRELACVLNSFGAVASSEGEQASAVARYQEALRLARRVGDVQVIAISLNNLGFTRLVYREPESATLLFEEALARAQEVRDTLLIANVLINLAFAALIQEDHRRVRALIEECFPLLQKAGEKQLLAECLETTAAMAGAQEKSERAARLWGAAEALREKIRAPLPAEEWVILKPYLDAARARLDEGAWERELAEGSEMRLKEAVEYALSTGESTPPASLAPEQTLADSQPHDLTPREKDVSALVARGLTNRQIAKKLMISEHTVATHIRRILKKLGFHSRSQISSWVTEQGLPRSGPS